MGGRSQGGNGEGLGGWLRRMRQAVAIRTEARGPGNNPAGLALEEPENVDVPATQSRTLASYFEPSLDAIGTFGAPIVIAGILGLIAGAVVVGFVGSMRTYGYIDIGIGAGLILLVALITLSSVLAAFFSRTGRYGVNAAVMVAAFTGIIVLINFASFEKNSRTDVTSTNQFSLHNTTKQLLKELDEPVRATAFYPENLDANPNASQGVRDRIIRRSKVAETFREFEAIRSSKFRFRFVDPTLDPETVRDYFGATPTPFINESIVVEGLNSGDIHVIQPLDAAYARLEQDLFTSILVVSGREQKTIYFLAGHGERDIQTITFGQNPEPEGYDGIRLGLEGDNYDVRTLRWGRLDDQVSVPDSPPQGCAPGDDSCSPGAALLVIAGPTEDLPVAHARALDLFLRGKKLGENSDLVDRREAARLIFLAEPNTPNSFLDFMIAWGVAVRPGYILDERRSIPSLPRTLQLQTVSPLDLPQELTRTMNPAALETLLGIIAPRGQTLGVIRMPGAAPVGIINDPNRISAPLAFTSENSYFIDDLGRTDPVKGSGEDADPKGPFSPVWYVQAVGPVGAPTPPSRPADNEIASMVVFGDSDFITNANYPLGSGADLFLNSANYLVGDYSLVSIRPKAVTFREFKLDRNEYNFVRFSSWLFMPGLLALMAAFVWWVRR